MSEFLLDFPWNDYCFQIRNLDLAATAVGEVITSGIKTHIPSSLKLTLLILGMIAFALLSWLEKEHISSIKFLLLGSFMLLLFLLGIAVLLGFVWPNHIYIKKKILSSTPTSSNILNLIIFFWITNVASVRQDVQEIYFPILLIPRYPLLKTMENHSSSFLITPRQVTVSGIRLC